MKKMKLHTPNLTEINIERIQELFPNCVTEAHDEKGQLRLAVDFDQLRQELSDHIVEGPQESYHLNWPGKRQALLMANAPIAKTLRPCREDSVDFDTTENLFIEGDNLDALKLLQETYLGKIKMIYIDPPYNTGKDFIYKDKFEESAEEYLLESNQKDANGNHLVDNLESNGRFHSKWLSMMYPRLKLARNLLKQDGVIFISIDDNEVSNLRKICDEIFGVENFLAEFPRVTKKAGKSTDQVAKNNDFVVCYRNSEDLCINSYIHIDAGFKHSDEYYDERGKYKLSQPLDYSSIQYSPSLDYEIEINGIILRPGNVSRSEMEERRKRNPKSDFCWRWSKKLYEFGLNNGFVVLKKGNNGHRIYTKTYEKVIISTGSSGYFIEKKERTKPATTLDFIQNRFSNDNSRKDIAKIFDEKVFEYSKPISLMNELIFLGTNKNDLVLDFFAGSATTAQAVMQLNAEDNGNRKFIMIQFPETCDEKSEAFKSGYKTIAEIGKERIRRAGKKIKDESAIITPNLDIGFRVLKIDSSNMTDVYYAPDALKQVDLLTAVDNIKPGRDNPEDLLFQVLLDWGVDLTLPIRSETIQDKTVLFVDDNALITCFDIGITEALVKELAAYEPHRVVFRDNGFASDAVKINVDQIFRQLSPTTEVKSI